MSKISIVGDVHIGNQVRSRKDDYFETCLLKLREVLSKSETVIFLGDLFNTPTLELYKIQRVAVLFLEFSHVKKYTIVGNHDLYNMNLATLDKTALGLLQYFGLQILTPEDNGIEICGKTFDTLPLRFDEIKEKDVSPKSDILLGHHFFNLPCEDSLNTNITAPYKAIFLGHDHKEYEPFENVYRPGSLLRNAATEYNFNRIPCYLTLDENFNVERVPLTVAQDSSAVFTKESLNQEALKHRFFTEQIDNLIERYSTQLKSVDRKTEYSLKEAFQGLKPPKKCYEYLKSVYNIMGIGLT